MNSALRNSFQPAKTWETTPKLKQLHPISNAEQTTHASRYILTANTNSSRQNNSIHDLTNK